MFSYGISSKTGRRKGEPLPKEPEKPIGRRFVVEDTTVEGLVSRLEANPRGLLLARDELSGFFRGLNQYKAGGRGADDAAFLNMFGARPITVDRKNPDKPSIHVPMANLSITGAIPPGVLKRVFDRLRMESGMAARFLMTFPPSRKVCWRETCVDLQLQDRLASMFDWLLSLPVIFNELTNQIQPAVLTLTSDAKKLWVPFHDEHYEEQAELEGDLSAAWAKMTGYAARLALCHQLASWVSTNDFERPQSISAESLAAGIGMTKWFAAETRRIYAALAETDEQRANRELIQYIRGKGGSITARDLSRGKRRYRDLPELAELDLEHLVRSRMADWQFERSAPQGGRPTRRCVLKPALLGDETSSNPVTNEGSGTVATTKSDENEEGEWTA